MPLLRFRTRRRAAATLAAVAAVLLAGGITAATMSGGGGAPAGESYVDGNQAAIMFASGHRKAVPDFSGTTLAGSPLSLSGYQGKVVVLNFWGSWCAPCRAEAPTLAALSARYRASGVQFLGVDVNDTPASAEAFERSYGITYPSLNDPGQAVAQVVSAVTLVSDTPTTLVIDRHGDLAGEIYGTATYSVLNTILSKVAA